MPEDEYDWLRTAVSVFGRQCRQKLSGGGSKESNIRGPLEGLLRSVGEHHQHHEVTWHDEFRIPDLGVRPDYAIRANGDLTGYIELKKPGLPVDPETFGRANREQWEKLRDLPNLLYSNGTEWRLFRDGEQLGETVFFRGSLTTAGDKLALADPAAFDALLKQFLRWTPPRLSQVSRLVQHIAPLCRLLRSAVLEQLAFEARSTAADDDTRARPFTGLRNDWRRLLFPSADDTTFADGYAQTLTFALLLARTENIPLAPDSFHEIGRRLDADHALMGKALQLLTDNVNERFTVTLDLLTRTVAQVDWPAIRAGNQDAYLHLYEHFLTVYDPARRQQSGSYYTPREIVVEMVRLTEDVLRTRLGQEEGFGGDEVKIIDPAMGTGTFLHTIIERVAEQAAARRGPAMARDAIKGLAGRLFGFELQMGPFAVAELRTSDLLKKHRATLPKGGLNLFVTNTLDNPFVEEEYLASTYGALSALRKRANHIKAHTPVTAVIANPPYDDKAEGRGGWVEKSATGQEPPPLDAFRYQGDGRYEHMLKNMYVYFWRWATWKDAHLALEALHGVLSSLVQGDRDNRSTSAFEAVLRELGWRPSAAAPTVADALRAERDRAYAWAATKARGRTLPGGHSTDSGARTRGFDHSAVVRAVRKALIDAAHRKVCVGWQYLAAAAGHEPNDFTTHDRRTILVAVDRAAPTGVLLSSLVIGPGHTPVPYFNDILRQLGRPHGLRPIELGTVRKTEQERAFAFYDKAAGPNQ